MTHHARYARCGRPTPGSSISPCAPHGGDIGIYLSGNIGRRVGGRGRRASRPGVASFATIRSCRHPVASRAALPTVASIGVRSVGRICRGGVGVGRIPCAAGASGTAGISRYTGRANSAGRLIIRHRGRRHIDLPPREAANQRQKTAPEPQGKSQRRRARFHFVGGLEPCSDYHAKDRLLLRTNPPREESGKPPGQGKQGYRKWPGGEGKEFRRGLLGDPGAGKEGVDADPLLS